MGEQERQAGEQRRLHGPIVDTCAPLEKFYVFIEQMKCENGRMKAEMRHLLLVRAVAESGTLTQAGVTLHLTQSALSHQLRDIESKLGARLFHRDGRRLTLTSAGETLLDTAKDVIARMERCEDAIAQQKDDGRGLLRITTECYTCYHWLPPVLKQYQKAHPLVEVRIDVGATDRPMAALLEGQVDVALVSEKPRDRRVARKTLFYDEYLVVMHPGHPLAMRTFIKPADFAGETLLTYSPASNSTVCQRFLAPAGVVPGHVLQVRLTEAIIEMAKAGIGVGVLSAWAVAPHVAAGTLRAVPLTRGRFGRTWSAIALKRAAGIPHVAAFMALMADARPFALPGIGRGQRSLPPPVDRRRNVVARRSNIGAASGR
jgi:LysR family transcriptional regulator for metE and metH